MKKKKEKKERAVLEKIRKPGKVDLGYVLCINNKTATLKVMCFFYRSLGVLRLRRLSSRSDINTNISLPFPTSDAAAVIGETNSSPRQTDNKIQSKRR